MSHDSQKAPSPSGPPRVPEALHAVLVAAAASRDYTVPGLHEEICNYVRDLRNAGCPPESVVVAIKHAVRDATLGLGADRLERRHSADLLDRAVRWCIEEYYGGGGGRS